jgi:hypothetical protein
MGDVVPYVATDLYYEGDADAGIVVEMVFKSDVDLDSIENKTIRLDNSLTNTSNIFSLEKIVNLAAEQIEDYDGIKTGDKIVLSTIVGEKGLVYTHDGVEYNMLSAVEPTGEWVYLTTGSNYLAIKKDGAIEVIASVKNKTYYYGV